KHKIVLTVKNSLDNTQHDIIGYLLEWNNQYEETNGKQADAIYMTRKVQALLLKNAVIVNEVSGAQSGRARVSNDELNTVLGGYGLPPVRLIKKTSANVKSPLTGEVNKIEL